MIRFARQRFIALHFPKFAFANYVNYYELLGVKKDATKEEIKQRFHQLAKLHHPDTQGSSPKDQDKFKEFVQAYNVLSNEQERKKFDDLFFNSQQHQSYNQQSYNQQSYNSQNQEQQPPPSETKQAYKKWSRQQENSWQFRQRQCYLYFTQREQKEDLYEEGLLNNMKKAPELYFVSLLMVAILIRWYITFLEARSTHLSRTFPEDPDFIQEKEQMNRKYSSHKKRVFINENECRHLPIHIIDEMEDSGDYEFAPLCVQKIEAYRNNMGQRIEVDMPPEHILRKGRKVQREVKDDTIEQAMIFKEIPTRKADYITKDNLQEILNEKKTE